MPHGEEFIALRKKGEELTGEEFNGGKIIGNRTALSGFETLVMGLFVPVHAPSPIPPPPQDLSLLQ